MSGLRRYSLHSQEYGQRLAQQPSTAPMCWRARGDGSTEQGTKKYMRKNRANVERRPRFGISISLLGSEFRQRL